MTKRQLEAYRSEQQEIRELKAKLQSIQAEDYNAYMRKRRLREKISRLEQCSLETEEWIENIPDSFTRRVFRMYYEEGQSQRAVAKRLHVDQSVVSRNIAKYLKNADFKRD